MIYKKSIPGSLSIDSNNENIVIGTTTGEFILYNIKTGSIRTFTGHSGSIWCIAITPDSKWVVTGGGDNIVKVWSIETGNIKTLYGHINTITSVAISDNGMIIVSGSADSTIRVWKDNGCIILNGHCGTVTSVDMNFDGSCIVSGGEDKTIRIWDILYDKNILITTSAIVYSIAINKIGNAIVYTNNNNVIKWSNGISTIICSHQDKVLSVAISDDTIVSSGADKIVIINNNCNIVTNICWGISIANNKVYCICNNNILYMQQ
jgi:WD40 repeat protein